MANKFIIIRDTREQKGHGWTYEAEGRCAGTERAKLDVGDYTVKGLEHLLVVERKSVGDLWCTLGKGSNYARFLREWNRCRDGARKYLIIEGTLGRINRGYRYSKVHQNNILAKLISLEWKHDVHVVFAGSADTASAWARMLMEKVWRYHQV